MWEERAERARREIAGLAAGGLDLAELYTAALAVVRRAVPFDQGCWAGVDPDTLGMTSVTNWRPWPVTDESAARFAESEYAGAEPNTFRALLRRPRPVARTSDAPHRDVVRSVRINDLLAPQGLHHELRAAFRVDEACWGVGSIFREGGQDFSDVHGELRAATPAAVLWLAEVEDAAPGGFTMTLHSVVAQAHASISGTARDRMRDAGGNWVVLQASRLITGDGPGQMVVTVEPATSHDVVSLLLAAYGVTARERDVCLEVLSGNPTADIAPNLFISPHTVHDHLKALYGRVVVGSRGELVAKLLI
ncbi:helix-turn-helix transcriptional regulator [Arthrobacter sp. 24S4-2]|uniref:helix-turn-helix transcriptional regulator n=1 Tax=Arthrobacter sp. 24S4-2 TaxID=2575374 RepID=UPI0010C7733E|nr:helix-turn-helix transcriptional regulator [Arthrobacter sp. 24S4-2]QCO97256.1 helix-turn-helix transcriptional regulator [Arthrobacter sp. 24S4-2]